MLADLLWVKCVFLLPNQTEENRSRVEIRLFLIPARALGISPGRWQVRGWKHPLFRAVPCCPLALQLQWHRQAAQPYYGLSWGTWPLPIRPSQITQPELLPFFIFHPMAPVSWFGGVVFRLSACHLELPMGRNHALLLSASPRPKEPLHRKGSNKCVWRNKWCD